MQILSIALVVCANGCGVAAMQAHTDQQAAVTTKATVIATVSADPLAPSGVLATAVEFSGVTEGVTETYLIPYMSAGQAKPQVGETCKLDWRWHRDFDWVTANGSIRGVRLVTKFDCKG